MLKKNAYQVYWSEKALDQKWQIWNSTLIYKIRKRNYFHKWECTIYLHGPISPQKYKCYDLWNTSFNIQNYFCCFVLFCHLAPKFRLYKYLTKFKPSPLNYPFTFPPLLTAGHILPYLPICPVGKAKLSVNTAVTHGSAETQGEKRLARAGPAVEMCPRCPPLSFSFCAFLSLRRFHFCWAQCFAQQVSYSSLNSF